jgi:hypothetical protein
MFVFASNAICILHFSLSILQRGWDIYCPTVKVRNDKVIQFGKCWRFRILNTPTVKTTSNFGIAAMSSQDLQAVVAAWQSGAISRDTMFELFRSGEILPDGRTNQDEAALIGSGPQPNKVGRGVPTAPNPNPTP